MAADGEKVEPAADSEQDEEEDVYEVERIIDIREEAGEVLYRVRWKNYCSDDDTWEPEAHLEDCREVLVAFKKNALAKKEAEAKKPVNPEPVKPEVCDADSESDSDKERPDPAPVKKKKKKKNKEEDEASPKDKEKKKKKEKKKDAPRPLPAPDTDEDEEEVEERALTPSPTIKDKKFFDAKKRPMDSDEEEDDPVPSKKHKKDKGKEAKKDKVAVEEVKKKKSKKEKKMESSEDEAAAPLEDDLSDGPSETPAEEAAPKDAVKVSEKLQLDDKSKEKRGKWEVKLQGIKDLISEKKTKKPDSAQKELSLQKLKNLTSKSREESAPHSDSSDSSSFHKKSKSKSKESASSSSSGKVSSSSASSSSTVAVGSKVREEELAKEEAAAAGQKDSAGPTNMFEKFLISCQAKDRAPRRQTTHPPPPPAAAAPEKSSSSSKSTKVSGKIEKIPKSSKDSPAQKDSEKTDRTKPHEGSKPGHSHGFSLDSDEREEEPPLRSRFAEDSRDGRRERPEEQQPRHSWERRTSAEERKKRREDSEPRLFMACDENQDAEPTESADKTDKGQATLSLGMDLNLDWMTLDDFQKHLNGEDEILSGPPLSPSELRDAVKSGDYMAVKLALNSKEDYNLDQEDVSGMSLTMLAAAGGQDDILRLLIKKGVRVNGRQKNGTTALMHAAEKNFLTTVAILLEAGSYVNAQALTGETALMKACKRGNMEIVRLLLEYGADCNIQSKHKATASDFAKLNNHLMVYDLIKDHNSTLSSVAQDTIRAYFESRLSLLESVFHPACHRLCEGSDFSMEFPFKPQSTSEGSGILLFIFHANFHNEIVARLCGPCSVHAVVLNDKFQLPIFLDSHFIYSFGPVPGINKLFIRLADAPTAKVKLLICAYRVQLQ